MSQIQEIQNTMSRIAALTPKGYGSKRSKIRHTPGGLQEVLLLESQVHKYIKTAENDKLKVIRAKYCYWWLNSWTNISIIWAALSTHITTSPQFKDYAQTFGVRFELVVKYRCKECNLYAGYYLVDHRDRMDNNITCQACQDKQDKQWELKKIARFAEAQGIFDGKIEAKLWERFRILQQYWKEENIAESKALPYPDFLKSTYWDIVRGTKLKRAKFMCELCNTKGELHVHHKTYEHHGTEHEHMNDLIVLCKGCHQTFHGKGATP